MKSRAVHVQSYAVGDQCLAVALLLTLRQFVQGMPMMSSQYVAAKNLSARIVFFSRVFSSVKALSV